MVGHPSTEHVSVLPQSPVHAVHLGGTPHSSLAGIQGLPGPFLGPSLSLESHGVCAIPAVRKFNRFAISLDRSSLLWENKVISGFRPPALLVPPETQPQSRTNLCLGFLPFYSNFPPSPKCRELSAFLRADCTLIKCSPLTFLSLMRLNHFIRRKDDTEWLYDLLEVTLLVSDKMGKIENMLA